MTKANQKLANVRWVLTRRLAELKATVVRLREDPAGLSLAAADRYEARANELELAIAAIEEAEATA